MVLQAVGTALATSRQWTRLGLNCATSLTLSTGVSRGLSSVHQTKELFLPRFNLFDYPLSLHLCRRLGVNTRQLLSRQLATNTIPVLSTPYLLRSVLAARDTVTGCG